MSIHKHWWWSLERRTIYLVFDLSFMVDEDSQLYNADCDSELKPDIFFGNARVRHLTYIYNLHISFPNEEIFIMDDDIKSAFRQIKYNPNVISAKSFIIGPWLFVCTGQNFGDQPSPANFEPIAKAQMALASWLSIGDHVVPVFPLYMNKVEFAPLPMPNTTFTPARPDRCNKGMLAKDGSLLQLQFNMYVDNGLTAAVGEECTHWNRHCSLHSAYLLLGKPDLDQWPNAINLDKFVREPPHQCWILHQQSNPWSNQPFLTRNEQPFWKSSHTPGDLNAGHCSQAAEYAPVTLPSLQVGNLPFHEPTQSSAWNVR